MISAHTIAAPASLPPEASGPGKAAKTARSALGALPAQGRPGKAASRRAAARNAGKSRIHRAAGSKSEPFASITLANGAIAVKPFSAVMAKAIGKHARTKDAAVATLGRSKAAALQSASNSGGAVIAKGNGNTMMSSAAEGLPPAASAPGRNLPQTATAQNTPTAAAITVAPPAVSTADANNRAEFIANAEDAPTTGSAAKHASPDAKPGAQPDLHNGQTQFKPESLAAHVARAGGSGAQTAQSTPPSPPEAAEAQGFPNALEGAQPMRPRLVITDEPPSPQAGDGARRRAAAAKTFAPRPKLANDSAQAARASLDARVQPASAGTAGRQAMATTEIEVQPGQAMKPGQAGQPAAAGNGRPAGTAEAAPESITDQVIAHLRANMARQGQQVLIHLNPPELGRVRLRLLATGKTLRGELKVDNPQTLDQLRLEAASLVRQLADSGVQIRRLDISLDDQGLEQPSDWLGRDGQRQQQQGPGEWTAQDVQATTEQEEPGPGPVDQPPGVTLGDDGSVNLWV